MAQTKAMTSGDPLQLILHFSIPLVLGNLFQQLYNIVDSAIVGQTMGADALGAVGSSSSVQFMVLGFCIGTAIGCTIPVATAFGANDQKRMHTFIYAGAVLMIAIAIVLTLVTSLLCTSILHLLNTPETLFEQAYAYLSVIFYGIPCTLLYNYCSALLRAIGNSRMPFLFLAFSATLNIFLDLFCILQLHWGVMGAAVATIASQGISGLLCLLFILHRVPVLHVSRQEQHFDADAARYSLGVSLPMGLQYSLIAIGSMVMQTQNNSLGILYVTAFAAGLKIKQLMISPFDAFATATSTFVSQNYGARQLDRIKAGYRQGMKISLIYSVFAGLVLIFFGGNLTTLFLDAGSSADIIAAAARYLRAIGFFYWCLPAMNVTRQTLQGLGHSRPSAISGVVEMLGRTVVATVFTPLYGYTAICWTDQAAWICGTIYVLICYKRIMKQVEQELAPAQAS